MTHRRYRYDPKTLGYKQQGPITTWGLKLQRIQWLPACKILRILASFRGLAGSILPLPSMPRHWHHWYDKLIIFCVASGRTDNSDTEINDFLQQEYQKIEEKTQHVLKNFRHSPKPWMVSHCILLPIANFPILVLFSWLSCISDWVTIFAIH